MNSTKTNTETALKHAIRKEIQTNGISKTKVTAIAQRAGLSRMTIHRRGKLESLILDALTDEFDSILKNITAEGSALDQLVMMCSGGIYAIANAPLTKKLLKEDADKLAIYFVERFGASQLHARSKIEQLIIAGQKDGSIRKIDPHLGATVTLCALQTFIVSYQIITKEFDWNNIFPEINGLIRNYLASTSEGSCPH